MQTNGIVDYPSTSESVSVMDGLDDGLPHAVTNGDCQPATKSSTGVGDLPKRQQEIIRIIGQHLRNLGLNRTVEQLSAESGCILENPAALQLRQNVLEGKWDKVDSDIQELQSFLTISAHDLTTMRLNILEQKYLEMLEDGLLHEALDCLRNQVTPLKPNLERVHKLSSYLMCNSIDDIRRSANWPGKGLSSRGKLLESLQVYLPTSMMVPPQRLLALLNEAVQQQLEQCLYHNEKYSENSLDSVSLFTDHVCSKEQLPCMTSQILSDHVEDVWFCRFSTDGSKLATGAKDGNLIIYDVNKETFGVTKKKTLTCQTQGVAHIAWSPDSIYLITCGPESSSELIIWNVETGQQKSKPSQSAEDSLTCAAWHNDGTRFVAGGTKGQFYLFNIEGNLLSLWEGFRVQGLSCLSDDKIVFASDSHNRIRSYNFDDHTDDDILRENHSIMSFTLNDSGQLALLNIATQGIHLWDVPSKCLVRKFLGVSQNFYTIHSCFGGINQNFIASGSEDNMVYLYHIKREQPIAVLEGHTRIVNCVHWNPKQPGMLASASDDGTVRIWVPASALINNNIDELNGSSSAEDHTQL